ncbi:aspartyl-phosphate phosphatase Spo0E family protein [Solibacillus sp. R5-41]|uniref:aspartyl-phosphate phosphatase Spo0E family protein n=1 Tax=Solibacillus sp. R5-41 TaxID=2048654 RepID=UPI0020A5900F|nr:aspartyl-phosphate phosphatase Spo0E family protein [Solibacillus sp. R5-41]
MDDAILIALEAKRQLMIKSGIENGLQSIETINLSKQVDRLINAFEEQQQHENTPNSFRQSN